MSAVKPVAIFRFSIEDGPGYFASFLDRHSVPWTLFKIDEGALPPQYPDKYAGFVFMGGPMSANDDLPWIAPIEGLIRRAVANDQPCIGHCLGGQLMAKALGGSSRSVRMAGRERSEHHDVSMARRNLFNPRRGRTHSHQRGLRESGVCHRQIAGHAMPHRDDACDD
jgi:GMP synthase-like glutamine amidotransferase